MAFGTVVVSLEPNKRLQLQGDNVRVTAVFSGDMTGSSVVFLVAYPDGSRVTFTAGVDSQVTGSGTTYQCVFATFGQGSHHVRVEGRGAVDASAELEFETDESVFFSDPPAPNPNEIGGVAVAEPSGAVGYKKGAEPGQLLYWDGAVWIPMRSAIRPTYDRTGVVPATTAITNALASRTGAWVDLGEGMPYIDGTINIPDGCAITGSPQSMREGSLVWSPSKPAPSCGTMVLARPAGNGKLFNFGFNSQVSGLIVHYPTQAGAYDPRTGVTQADSATFTPYDYTFNIDGKFGCAITNCTLTNSYQGIYVNNTQGALIDAVRGWPLFRGIKTGRVYDVLRMSRVHFNQNVLASNLTSPLLAAQVLASGVGFLIDGCDDFKLSNSYCGNYQFGVWVNDSDGDGWLSYGDVTEVGIECVNCMVVECASFHGLRVIGASWAPNTNGCGLKLQDNFTPASAFYRPNIELYGVRIGGGTQYLRGVWATNTSHAVVTMWGGGIVNYQQYAFATDGANAIIKYTDVKVPASPVGGSSVNNGGTGISGTAIAV